VELQCKDYADIAFLKSIYFYELNRFEEGRACFNQGVNMFDGVGFNDQAFISDGLYSTYKVALWKIARNFTGLTTPNHDSDAELKMQNRLIGNMQNITSGGEYTHYSSNLIPRNETNVETTVLALIASKLG